MISLTFHDSAVKPIDLPREGWAETPVVYAVLRARNAAVDRIPSIQMDMDFVDQPGQVVLPVMSQAQPLDARDATVENRPCGELALDLTMDEREWNEGRVIVEIQARGQGIIPKLEELFECDREGFTLDTVDGNLSVTQLTNDGSKRVPQADRNWQLSYRHKPDLRGDVSFPFPKLKDGIKLTSQVGNAPRNAVFAAVLAALIRGFVWIIRRRKTRVAHVSAELTAPENPTPFATVALLRRIHGEHGEHLSDNDRSALKTHIREIETGYFSGAQAPAMDLNAIVSKWLSVVRKLS